jgi:Uma2 family endonuclease
MNERFQSGLHWPATTQAADGMPRRPGTVAEIEAMVQAGIIQEDERFELIGGDAVPMLPKGGRHELVKIYLNEHFQLTASDDLRVAQATTLRLDSFSFLEPDFCVFPRSIFPSDMRGYDVLLAIEVSDTSLRYDLGRKIGVYAAFGIPEVWVIDANTLVTRVHRRLGAEGYAEIADIAHDGLLEARRAPSVSVRLADLGLTPL